MAIRMAATDTQVARQSANDGEQCPDFLDCGAVGKVQYSGLTRFLQADQNIANNSNIPEEYTNDFK